MGKKGSCGMGKWSCDMGKKGSCGMEKGSCDMGKKWSCDMGKNGNRYMGKKVVNRT